MQQRGQLTFFTLTRMQLDLQLSDGQRLSSKVVPGPTGGEIHRRLSDRRRVGLRLEKVEEGGEGSKLCSFNVDFQDIDEIVTVVFHEPSETPHFNIHVGTVVINGAECPGLEVGSMGVGPKFGAPL